MRRFFLIFMMLAGLGMGSVLLAAHHAAAESVSEMTSGAVEHGHTGHEDAGHYESDHCPSGVFCAHDYFVFGARPTVMKAEISIRPVWPYSEQTLALNMPETDPPVPRV